METRRELERPPDEPSEDEARDDVSQPADRDGDPAAPSDGVDGVVQTRDQDRPVTRDDPHALPPVSRVFGEAAIAGLIAGFATGLIDAVWSWGSAAQFVPGIASRLRFVVFTGASYAMTAVLVGVALAAGLLVLSRATRIGDLARFGFAEHVSRRARDPRDAVAGLALAIAGLPSLAACLFVAYRTTLPFVTGRHEMRLVVIVAIAATLVAIGVALVLAFVLGRLVELGLRRAARRPALGRPLSWPYAPLVAIAAMIALALAAWAKLEWETARVLPLRGPVSVVIGLALAVAAMPTARQLVARASAVRTWQRRAAWAALVPLLVVLVVLAGGSDKVIKSASSYTGLGGSIARTLRRAFDWDGDGYARWLGGGDCDDGDPRIHPGAPEIPDDGIDQNCVGGDASLKHTADDVAFAPVPASVPKDFDVLLITIDTTRADHLGMYGYRRATSPALDKLAGDGVVFEHGWAHAPSTRYSMPAILTGRLPLDVYYDTTIAGWPGLLPKGPSLACALQPLGFYTSAITNYEYFDRSRHMDRCFAEYDNENARLHTQVGQGPAATRGSSSKEQSDKAIAFVDKHPGERWFLWVHYYDPHYEYERHPGIDFGSKDEDRYDGEIRYTDLHIERLLDTLRAKGLYDKTVVVVTGDHGEGFGEHGVLQHGYHLYSPQTKVPFVIRVPGLPPHRSTTPAGHVDILPTLVNLAGGQPTTEMMGRSLVDVLAGAPDRDRVIHQQLSYENNNEMRAGVSRQCHVIYNVSPNTSWEVYRVDQDPLEERDLADGDDCSETRSEVEHWYDSEAVPPGFATAQVLTARPPIANPLDADLGDARLLAVDAPATVHRGDQVTVTWTWEIRGAIAPGWRVFVHAEGPAKGTFLNGDHPPPYPFEWIEPGKLVRYTTTLAIPRVAATGRYTLWTGLFRGNERAHASSSHARIADDAVAAATLEVAP
jgi:arylsulfatase A-like enzyme